jgi:glycosyltransferase involved in cell wall biosynthesis
MHRDASAHRVLFFTENYPPDRGGMSTSCDRIVRGLTRAGAAVDVVAFDRRVAVATLREGVRGNELRWPLDVDPAHTINCLWNHLQQSHALDRVTHVVAFGGFLPLLAAPAIAAWIDRPLVTLLRGNELDAGLFDTRRRPMLDDALRRSAAVCCVTSEQAAKVSSLHRDTTTHCIANGIDFELWQLTDCDRARAAAWRNEHVSPGRRVLGFFGHLKAKKGVSFFIETLRRSGLGTRFHLLLAGDVEAQLDAQLAANHELAFTRLDARDRFDLLPLYAACDLVALPSHYDGFPNVLIEAASLGKPLLASSVGGMRDLLSDADTAVDGGANAFLFRPGDEHDCRRAITRAAAIDDASLALMGARAETLARQRCDARDETQRYLGVLDATARRNSIMRSVEHAR